MKKAKHIKFKCLGCDNLIDCTEKESKTKKYCSKKCHTKDKTGKHKVEHVQFKCLKCENIIDCTKKEAEIKKYCSVKCQIEGYRGYKVPRITIKCKNCNKEIITTKKRIEKHGRNSCSVKCRNKLLKTKYIGAGNPMYGAKHSEERIKQISENTKEMWKSKEFRDHLKSCAENFYKIKKYYYGNSQESIKKRKQSCIEHFGVDHNWKNTENKKKCDDTCLEKYGKTSLELMKEGLYKNKKNTSIEVKIHNILNNNDIEYVKQFEIKYKKTYKVFDIYIPKLNLLIEADGDYWHANPIVFKKLSKVQESNIKNDKIKNQLAKQHNFILLRFWGSEIVKKEFELTFIQILKNVQKDKN